MKQTLAFIPPIISSTESPLAVEVLDEAKELYDAGKHREAILRFLDGLGVEIRKRFGNAEGNTFVIPHGHVQIKIELGESQLSVSIDFLQLPEGEGRVAMMRQMVELNTRRLMLARFVKRQDRMSIEYRCPLSETHPYKLYALFNNFCHVGNEFSSEFVAKFGAKPLCEPQIAPYSTEQIARIHAAIQETGRYVLDVIKEYSTERNHTGAWIVASVWYLQFLYYAQPKGELFTEIDKALDDLDDDLPTSEQVIRASRLLEELMARSPEQLASGLYYTQTFMSHKRRSSLQIIQENIEKGFEEATQSMQSSNFERAAIRLWHVIYRAYHHHDMQDDINALLRAALEQSGSKPVEEGAKILYEAVRKLMDGDLTPLELEASGQGGLLRRLWRSLFK